MNGQLSVAVLTAYSPGAQSAAALEWLQHFQGSPEAWQASADVLTGDPNAALEVRFFAAQTLCQKVRRQLSTLSEGDIVPLQSSLEKCIYTSAGGPMPILAQLCAAMATLIVQRPEAGGPLDVLKQGMPRKAVASILEALPSAYIEAPAQSRLEISDVASQAVGLLLLEMQQLGSPKTEAGALFQAFEAWLAAGYLINLADDSACLTLINLAFQVLDLPNAESEVIERAWRVIEEALENCPEALISTFQVSCWGFADKALLEHGNGNLQKCQMWCSLFSTMCCSALSSCMCDSQEGNHLRLGLLKLACLPWAFKDEFQEEPISAPAIEAWMLFGDYVMNAREGRDALRPAFVAFLQGFLPVLSSVQGSFNEASVGSFNPLEAAAVSGEVIGYEALVDCVHNQVRSNTCSAMVGLAALSASLEIKPSSFGRATCEKILEIYQGALVGSTHTPANAAPVISSLASTIESLLRSLHESGAEKEWQEVQLWSSTVALAGLQNQPTRHNSAKLLRRTLSSVASTGTEPIKEQVLIGTLGALKEAHNEEVDVGSELAEAFALGLVNTPCNAASPLLQALLVEVPQHLQQAADSADPRAQHPSLQHATLMLRHLAKMLSVAGSLPKSCAIAQLAPQILQQLWPVLEPVLRLAEASSLRSIVGECCQHAMQASPGSSASIMDVCAPTIPFIFDLNSGHSFLTVIAAFMQVGGSSALGVAQAAPSRQNSLVKCLDTVSHSFRVQRLSTLQAGDAYPDEAEDVLEFVKAVAAIDALPSEVSHAAYRLLEQGIAVSSASIPCRHRTVALAALACMTSLIDRLWLDCKKGSNCLLAAVITAGPQIVAALLLALLGPSPLVRVHKATCLLAALARLPGCHPNTTCQWLQSALHSCGGLSASEAEEVLKSWVPAILQGASLSSAVSSVNAIASSRSGQQLKKQMRAFAERHNR